MDVDEVIAMLMRMVDYWEGRSQAEYDYKNHQTYIRYMNACAEAAVLLAEKDKEVGG